MGWEETCDFKKTKQTRNHSEQDSQILAQEKLGKD